MDLIVTGMPSSGKSFALKEFEKYGFKTIDADEIAGKIYRKNSIKKILSKKTGKKFTGKKKLAKKIFSGKNSDEEIQKKLRELNSLVHPLVLRELMKEKNKIKKSKPNQNIVFEIPVLSNEFGKKFLALGKAVAVVHCSEKERLKRLKKKFGAIEAKKRSKIIPFNFSSLLAPGKKIYLIESENKELLRESIESFIGELSERK